MKKSKLYANIKLNKIGLVCAYVSFALTLGNKCWIPRFGYDVTIEGR